MTPKTIILPGIVAHLERFLRPLAATAGDGIEIRQTERHLIIFQPISRLKPNSDPIPILSCLNLNRGAFCKGI